MKITPAHLKAIANGPAPLAAKLVGPINKHAAANGIVTKQAMAHFLAHMAHETGGFTSLSENLNYTSAKRIREVWPSRFKNDAAARPYVRQPQKLAEKVYGGRLGNVNAGDGWRYRGGGPYQLTGRENYRKFGAKAGVDLEGSPELARDPDTGVEVAAKYFAACMAAAAARDDIKGTTKALNGGENGIADRRACLARAKAILGKEATAKPASAPPVAVVAVPVVAAEAEPYTQGQQAPEIERLQTQLRALGYWEVGKPDGKWGTKTRGALLAFKADNDLPLTPALDDETWTALGKAEPRAIAPARAEAPDAPGTVGKVSKAGENTMKVAAGLTAAKAADDNVTGGAIQSGIATMGEKAGDGIDYAIGVVTGAGEKVGEVQTAASPLLDLFSTLKDNWPLLVLIAALGLFWAFRTIRESQRKAYQQGRLN